MSEYALDVSRLANGEDAGAEFKLGDAKPYFPPPDVLALVDETSPRKMGRPSDCKPEVVAAVVDALETGATMEEAALSAGISLRTFHRWREKGARSKTLDDYRQFYQITEIAKRRARRLLERCAYKGGRTDPKLAVKILERRHPEDWRLRLEIEDPSEANVERVRDVLESRLASIEKRLRGVGATLTLPESPAARLERESEEPDWEIEEPKP